MADRIIYGEGSSSADVMLIGERPGPQEYEEGRPFVGPSGDELWSRFYRATKLRRADVYVTNLVKTFSMKPPTAAEILRDADLLRAELYKVRPSVIVTIGYHAARALLPQFADENGDRFHGLAFPYTFGRLRPTTATVVPCCHAAAALRQPDRYANQLADDFAAVARVLAGEQGHHQSTRLRVFPSGLAGFGREGQTLGVDTEGTAQRPEAVTLAGDPATRLTHCSEVWERPPSKYLGAALRHSRRLYIHHLKHDWQVLATLGIDLASCHGQVDDTMLMAYVLGLPQGLKNLAYRLCGIEMTDYDDLIRPLDESLVRAHLQELYGRCTKEREQIAASKKAAARAAREAKAEAKKRSRREENQRRSSSAQEREGGPGRDRADRTRDARDGGRVDGRGSQEPGRSRPAQRDRGEVLPRPEYPPRAWSSLKKLLTGPPTETPLRTRWQGSTFAPLLVLPPAPTWKDTPVAERREYATLDAVAHRAVGELLRPLVKERGLQTIYQIDRAALPFLIRNEQVGLACDGARLEGLSAVFAQEYRRVLAKIESLVGYAVNPLAAEDTSGALLDCGVNLTRLTRSKKFYTTEDKYLKAHRHEHAIVDLVIAARQINKMKATYADRLPRMLRDGRYYPNWKYTRTATGRLAEEIIILMPKHSKRGKKIRRAFHATDGHALVSCDLSQIEMRCMAHLSQDPELLRVYARGEDVHAHTAHTVLGAPKRKEDQDESKHRLPSKTFNFAIINGSTEYGILDQLHEHGLFDWDLEKVQAFLAGWFQVHAGVQRFWDEQKAHARRFGYVKDMFGRRRYLAAIHSSDFRVVRGAERQALFAIQASADAISKLWNAKIWKRILVPRYGGKHYAEPWVRTHDDTTIECDERISKEVSTEMLALVPNVLCIPTTAEAKIGPNWSELH